MPSDVLDIIMPTNFISLTAKPEIIYARRNNDAERDRDKNSIRMIKKELGIQDAMISACSVHSGSPVKHIYHKDGKSGEAVQLIVEAVGF